jgi:hypothetical protein
MLPIGLPDRESARELFERRLNPSLLVPGARLMVDEVVELCGRLPLALSLLAEQLSSRPASSLAGAAAELRDETSGSQPWPMTETYAACGPGLTNS